jgi:hypothetical protein
VHSGFLLECSVKMYLLTLNQTVTEYCLNETPSELVATASAGHTLTWYDDNNNILSTAASRTPSTTSAVSTLYKVTQTDANGCESAPLNITVTVHALPPVNAGADVEVCDGESVVLTATNASTYSWSGGISNGVSFTPPSSTMTTYTVTGTDANGCVGTDVVNVTSNAAPLITLSASPSAVCSGDDVVLTATGGATYTWGPGVTSGATGSTQTVNPTTSTTYTVTGEDGTTNCTVSASVTVTVNQAPVVPTVNPANITEYCLNETPSELVATPLRVIR